MADDDRHVLYSKVRPYIGPQTELYRLIDLPPFKVPLTIKRGRRVTRVPRILPMSEIFILNMDPLDRDTKDVDDTIVSVRVGSYEVPTATRPTIPPPEHVVMAAPEGPRETPATVSATDRQALLALKSRIMTKVNADLAARRTEG